MRFSILVKTKNKCFTLSFVTVLFDAVNEGILGCLCWLVCVLHNDHGGRAPPRGQEQP